MLSSPGYSEKRSINAVFSIMMIAVNSNVAAHRRSAHASTAMAPLSAVLSITIA
jgi:hypothetical protein